MNTIATTVPSSGIAPDTSVKQGKKPPTQAQRDDKNRKLREKRAAAAATKALPPAELPKAKPARGQTTSFQHIDELAVITPKMAQDAMPKYRPAPLELSAKELAAHKARTPRGPRSRPAAEKSKGGRRAIYGEPMHTVSFKCTKEQHATFLRVGGNVYLRERLDELTAIWKKKGGK